MTEKNDTKTKISNTVKTRDKIPWIIAWIIGGIIFVTWFFNLDYLWKGKQSVDSFMQSIQEAGQGIGEGFKDFGNAMQGE